MYCGFVSSFKIYNLLVSFLQRLEQTGKEVESGATATVMFIRNDILIISHIGDSCVVSPVLILFRVF